MNMNSKEIVSKLEKLLEQKRTALEAIYRLTLGQQEDIEKNQGENLESYIDEKQKEIDKIIILDKAFTQTFQILKSEFKVESLDSISAEDYPQFKTIKKVIGEIMDLGGKITELEEGNKTKVKIIIDDIKSQLKGVKQGKKSLKAYEKAYNGTSGVYIDRKK